LNSSTTNIKRIANPAMGGISSSRLGGSSAGKGGGVFKYGGRKGNYFDDAASDVISNT
jgi:hypothetical protein